MKNTSFSAKFVSATWLINTNFSASEYIKISYIWTAEKEMKKWLIIAVIYTAKTVVKLKPEKNSVLNGIRTHDLCDTGAENRHCEKSENASSKTRGKSTDNVTFNCLVDRTSALSLFLLFTFVLISVKWTGYMNLNYRFRAFARRLLKVIFGGKLLWSILQC